MPSADRGFVPTASCAILYPSTDYNGTHCLSREQRTDFALRMSGNKVPPCSRARRTTIGSGFSTPRVALGILFLDSWKSPQDAHVLVGPGGSPGGDGRYPLPSNCLFIAILILILCCCKPAKDKTTNKPKKRKKLSRKFFRGR